MRPVWPWVCLCALACGDERSPGSGSATATDSGISVDDSGSGIESVTNGEPKLDVEGGSGDTEGGGEGGPDDGCQKVDFLFVIDSSNSMETNQAALIASFPEFVAGIQGTLEDVDDYHVGVVTSDAYQFNEQGCTLLGALVTQTGGKDSGMETCSPFATPARYMTEVDDLPTAFSCAAQVGTDGNNDEAMLGGAINAISPALGAGGACNEGFIREDALLVMVLISDEDDPGTCVGGFDCMGTDGDPSSWYTDVLAVKQHPENVVVLSLTRGAPDNVCGPPEGTELDGERIMEFTEMWGSTGLRGDICAQSYGAFFDQAVNLVDSACSGFVEPEG